VTVGTGEATEDHELTTDQARSQPDGGAIAALLSDPDSVRSVHQPIAELATGSCTGYRAVVRIADWAGQDSGPWFEAATQAGLSGDLAGLALRSALRARVTMPGDRFLLADLSSRTLTSEPVTRAIEDEDDVADLVLCISGEVGPAANALISRLRRRGMRFAASAGPAGLPELRKLRDVHPDLIVLPPALVRGADREDLQQALIALVVDLADDLGGSVLADGVETLGELVTLRGLGVRWAQGWLLGPLRPAFHPLSIDLAGWLAAHPELAGRTPS